jgi:hypothetical protein
VEIKRDLGCGVGIDDQVEKTRFSPLDLDPDGSLDYIYHKHSWYEPVGNHQTQLVIRRMNLDANCWSLL